jgi:hypothetical protein
MGRHHRAKSRRALPAVILALSVASVASPIVLLTAWPSAKADPIAAQAIITAKTTETTTPTTTTSKKSTKKVVTDKDGNPIESTTTRRSNAEKTQTRTSEAEVVATQSRTSTTTGSTPHTTSRTPTTTTTKTPTSSTITKTQTVPSSTTTRTQTVSPPIPSGRTSRLGLALSAAIATEDILRGTGFTGVIHGVGARPDNPTSDHPRGYAVDFMTTNLAVGNRIRDYALANQTRLGVKYVIWQAPDHFNHVHISFIG